VKKSCAGILDHYELAVGSSRIHCMVFFVREIEEKPG
jgi:hypothetical protein